MKMGMGVSMGLRMSMSPRIGISMTPTCTLCGQQIGEWERVPFEQQIAELTAREQEHGDKYNPCFGCRNMVEVTPRVRKKVDSYIRYLRRMRERMERSEAKLRATTAWPKDTPSLVGQFWDGCCPIDDAEMLLNTSDRFECPKCRIQFGTDGRVHVLRDKGLRKFKTKAVVVCDQIVHNKIMAIDELPGIGAFRIEEDHRTDR